MRRSHIVARPIMKFHARLLREALASIRSQPVASVLTAVVVAGLCVAALLTTGRTVAAEQAVLAKLDSVGTRTIIVRADLEAGITTDLLDRMDAVEGVEALAGFGPVIDARNAAVRGGLRVPVRRGYGVIGGNPLTRPESRAGMEELAIASREAKRAAGLLDGIGGVRTDAGQGFAVRSGLTVPSHLRFLEPLIVVPSSSPGKLAGSDPHAPLAVIVVLVKSPPEVVAVEAVVRSMLKPPEHSTVTVETSAQLAAIRSAIGGQLGSHGRATVLGILIVSAVLVAFTMLGLVTMRRKDFGRRRALGATRSLIARLIVSQVALLSLAGAITGTTASLVWLGVTGDPIPDIQFILALSTLGVVAAVLGSIAPAVAAASRDPLHELRVP